MRLRSEGAVVVGGLSEARHLLTCRERRSLRRLVIRGEENGGGKAGESEPSSKLIATVLALVGAVAGV